MTENTLPRSVSEIAGYHAHVYYDPATTRPEAERLRRWMEERFAVTLGRWHDVKVGPHDQAMFQVAFAVELFATLVPWLMLNHGSLSVLVHPNTDNPRRDHLANPLWIGSALAVMGRTCRSTPRADRLPLQVPPPFSAGRIEATSSSKRERLRLANAHARAISLAGVS